MSYLSARRLSLSLSMYWVSTTTCISAWQGAELLNFILYKHLRSYVQTTLATTTRLGKDTDTTELKVHDFIIGS